MDKKISEPKPFHESIVDTINGAVQCELSTVLVLVGATVIPKNHDAIIEAINVKRKELGLSPAIGVINHVLRQKALAERKVAEKIAEKSAEKEIDI